MPGGRGEAGRGRSQRDWGAGHWLQACSPTWPSLAFSLGCLSECIPSSFRWVECALWEFRVAQRGRIEDPC